jgi:two-component system, NtrC family, nitrogen regulation sensor histidine kinase NtrY
VRDGIEGEDPHRSEDAEAPHRPFRRREVFLLAATALAVVLFLFFETRLPPFTSGQTLSQNVVFFLLINLNIVLILLVVFLLGRNIVKLVVERRQGVLGSHLRTRLVAGFVGVAIAPAIFLFLVALGFIRTSIESWFAVRIESALEGSVDMADVYYRESMATALREAQELARRLNTTGRRIDAEAAIVAEKQREYGAAVIAVYDAEGRLVSSAEDPGLNQGFRVPPNEAFLERALAEPETVGTIDLEVGDVLRATTRIVGRDDVVRGVVVVDRVVPAGVVRRRDDIQESARQYRQLKLLRRPLINNYVLTLLLASLVVLFGGTWLGFVIARSITGPIQRLAEGTRRVAAGHLDEQIPPESGSDEVATLVEAFNQMTANLRATHTELAERSRTLETILANIGGGVVSIDAEGQIEMINPAAYALLGVEHRGRGVPFRDAFAEPRFERVRELLAELEERARVGSWDKLQPQRMSVLHPDGAVELLASGVVLHGAGAGAIGALLFFEDVTELLKVQRMEAWREVARRIAHEIKNPLTPIQLSAQRLRRRYAGIHDGEILDECTRTIIAQVEVLKSLVSEFAHFARLPAGQHVPSDLQALVDEVLVLFREAHRDVRFVFRRGDDVPELRLDRDGIRRVLTNILDNAVAALPAPPPARDGEPPGAEPAPDGGDSGDQAGRRGTVEVVTRHVSDRGVICLEVADDGVGMTPQVKARLFEPYFSTKPQGTGLGLAIASAVLAEHRAFIRVRDNAPRGSRFVIEFPVREGAGATAGSVSA